MSAESIDLSARQAEILALVAEGLTNAQIGAKLHLSEDTIKTNLRRLSLARGARNRAHLVHLAHQWGLLHAFGPGSPLDLAAAPVPPPVVVRPRPAARRDTEPLFRKVGMVHKAVTPKSVPEPPPEPARTPTGQVASPTHIFNIDHPADPSRSWQVDISVIDDEQALRRGQQLADWTEPPFRVSVTRLADQVRLTVLDGCRRTLAEMSA